MMIHASKITPELYEQEISRLVTAFGAKAFNVEKARILFNKISGHDYHAFTKVVDGIIAEYRMAPSVSEISMLLSQESGISTPRQGESEWFENGIGKFDCSHCSSSGYISAKKNGVFYAFKCFCKNGEIRIDAFPIWGRRYMDKGFINTRMAQAA